jgi:hypothetical protein
MNTYRVIAQAFVTDRPITQRITKDIMAPDEASALRSASIYLYQYGYYVVSITAVSTALSHKG